MMQSADPPWAWVICCEYALLNYLSREGRGSKWDSSLSLRMMEHVRPKYVVL